MEQRPGMRREWDVPEKLFDVLVISYLVVGMAVSFTLPNVIQDRHRISPWWTYMVICIWWTPIVLLALVGIFYGLCYLGKETWKIRPRRVWKPVGDMRKEHKDDA